MYSSIIRRVSKGIEKVEQIKKLEDDTDWNSIKWDSDKNNTSIDLLLNGKRVVFLFKE